MKVFSMQDVMSRVQLFSIIILGLFIGILGCNVKLQSITSSDSVSILPNNVTNVTDVTREGIETNSVSFLDDYSLGFERAKREMKLMLLFFTISNSDASQRMLETTFCDEEIRRLSERFICIRVDGFKESDFCKSLGIKGFPTVLFMTPQGEELQRLTGKLTPDQLALPMHVMIQSTAIRSNTAAIRK
ncbi:MAG: thioredoxin family protein [Planctomycetaceae bacterium]|jgi:thioredoxin-related protein|nr:thioredoxin family protein [Planctomycetaceae bacterium]